MSAAPATPAEFLERLVAFDTTSRNSNMALIDWVRAYLEMHGVASRLVENDDGTKANLFATVAGQGGGEGEGGVALSGHTDVVPVDGQDWSSDPFKAERRDGRIYGRGTCDMKGFIATALALVPEMTKARLKEPIHLAFSYDEEIGCQGAPRMIAELGRALPKPRLVLVGEPTSMRIADAHKGVYGFRTRLRGLEAHSSATHRGVSAVMAAGELIGFMAALARELAAEGPLDQAFDPPYTSINVGRIEGGTALNIIARDCTLDWEFRPVPGADPAAIEARVQAFVDDELLPRMRAIHPEARIETERLAGVPPLVPDAESPALALARMLTGANRTETVAFAAEAGQYQEAGVPAVLIGPGDIAQAHQPDEFVAVEQLDACERLLRKLIDTLRA